MEQLNLGNVTLSSLSEIEACKVDIEFLFNSLSQDDMEKNLDWLDTDVIDVENQKLGFAFRAYLVKFGRVNVLVDACNGNHKQRPTARWQHNLDLPDFLDEIKEAVGSPEQVDYVICTHLHCDHVGWLTQLKDGEWTPTFKNAVHVFSDREYNFYAKRLKTNGSASVNHGSFEDSVQPVIKSCGYKLVPSSAVILDESDGKLELVPSPGHSIDHLSVKVSSKGEEAVICGDAVHHPLQLDLPDIPMRADYDPELATQSRRALLDYCSDTGAWLLAGHFAKTPFAKIKRVGDRFRFR